MSATPDYVPPQLAGKISNFRDEPDGSLSFDDPSSARGNTGPDAMRHAISPQQRSQTFDRDYRLSHWDESMANQYTGDHMGTNRAEGFKKWIADTAQRGLSWGTSSQGRSVGTAGLLSALAGGAAGAWMGHREGTNPITKGLLYALAAGGAGAGITALAQNQSNKAEALYKQASRSLDTIVQALSYDTSLTPTQKSECIRALYRASADDCNTLSDLLSTAAGAAGGVLVMRFLGAKGLLPSLAGGMIGAWLGSPSQPGRSYNALGQISL